MNKATEASMVSSPNAMLATTYLQIRTNLPQNSTFEKHCLVLKTMTGKNCVFWHGPVRLVSGSAFGSPWALGRWGALKSASGS